MYTATITFEDGTTDTVENVEDYVFEWLHEELNDARSGQGLYLQRTDGGTVMKKTGIRRVDVVKT